MTLLELENDLITCKNHLQTTNSNGTEIESFLTRFLLVHICGEYEKEIKRILVERAHQSGDPKLASYIEKSIQRVRNIKVSDLIGNILRRFSNDSADYFEKKIKGTEEEIRYNNIITNRDKGAAHGGVIFITFDELIISHTKAKEVLKILEEAINH